MLGENLIFFETSGLKLETTSYSDNAFDIINFFAVLKLSWTSSISAKFHCHQTPNGRVKLRGTFCLLPPPSIIWVSQTPYKTDLKLFRNEANLFSKRLCKILKIHVMCQTEQLE